MGSMIKNIKKMSFEDAITELKELTSKLQGSNVSLDDLVYHYENGIKLKQHAYQLLNTAKIKIEKAQRMQSNKIDDFKEEMMNIYEDFIDNAIAHVKNNEDIDYESLVLMSQNHFNMLKDNMLKDSKDTK